MGIIKTNYNNAAVKFPSRPMPVVYAYRTIRQLGEDGSEDVIRITVEPCVDLLGFYNAYEFVVYVNGKIKYYMTEGTPRTIEAVEDPDFQNPTFTIEVRGTYQSRTGYSYEFTTGTTLFHYALVCSESVYCAEDLYVLDADEGYFDGDYFYSTMTNVNGTPEYDGRFERIDGKVMFDILTGVRYMYNESEGFYDRMD